MDTASEVLVIIVSAVLAIFLIVLIIVGVYTIKVLKQVRRVTERAENVAGSVEAAASTFGKVASPLAVLKLVGAIVRHSSKRKD
jgi:uncharacterized protein YoxC